MALVGVKCTQTSETQFFLNAATGIIEVENALHNHFLKNELIHNEPSPTCELYISYLTKMTSYFSIEENLAAVLPCFTIYKEIGDYILANQNTKKNNPYQNWINTYGGEDFAKSVSEAVAITNKYADNATDETIQKMSIAFEKASKLELMFWDSAYKKEKWLI